MAITTLDGLIAGLRPPELLMKTGTTMEAAGVLHSLFYTAGRPGAAVAPSPGLAGAALTSYGGQVPYTDPVAGNGYLARLEAHASIAGCLIVADRLWHNSGLVVSTLTAQTVNSATWPARDMNGSTNGEGVLVGIEVSTATTNVSAVTNTTMSYTNQGGTSGRTATIPSTGPGAGFPATAVAGTFVPFQLAAGDSGVGSIQSVTLGTSYAGGAIHLVAYRVLAVLPVPVANVGQAQDALAVGLPRLYNGTVPFLLWLPTATTAATVAGQLTYAHG